MFGFDPATVISAAVVVLVVGYVVVRLWWLFRKNTLVKLGAGLISMLLWMLACLAWYRVTAMTSWLVGGIAFALVALLILHGFIQLVKERRAQHEPTK